MVCFTVATDNEHVQGDSVMHVIKGPKVIEAAGNRPKVIEEFVVGILRGDHEGYFAIVGIGGNGELSLFFRGSHRPANHLRKETLIVFPGGPIF